MSSRAAFRQRAAFSLFSLGLVFVMAASSPGVGLEARSTMQARDIDYRCEDINLRGYLAFDEKASGRRPGIAVFHEGLGLGDFAMARARMLAELGYVALAADMFGDRRQARNLVEVADEVC